MSQHFTFKRVFARLYSPESLANCPLDQSIDLSPDGHLAVRLSTPPDVIDPGVRQPIRSVTVLRDGACQDATTPDGHYRAEINTYEQGSVVEFWLIHLDQTTGSFKRAKLSAGSRVSHRPPRLAASPGGSFFLADDNGTVRLYDAVQLHNLGAFEVAHASTMNGIVALAVSADDRFVAALSSWKDFVLYHVPERRVVSVRHIADPVGWYDQAFILILGNGAAVVTAGRIMGQNAAVSINVYHYIAQNVWRKGD